MSKTTNRTQEYTNLVELSTTGGAASKGKHYFSKVFDISGVIDTILAIDGAKPNVSSINLRIVAVSNDPFTYRDHFVQTAGTVTSGTDIAEFITDRVFDGQIDDLFGSEPSSPRRAARFGGVLSTDDVLYQMNSTVVVPRKILDVLNRDSESEVTSKINFVLEGIYGKNDQIISFEIFYEINFTKETKQIIIR